MIHLPRRLHHQMTKSNGGIQMSEKKIRLGVVGLGNCASSLIQGIYFYKNQKILNEAIGLMHPSIGGYFPGDIEIVSAFDIDQRKVGKTVDQALFAAPNCTVKFCELPSIPVAVEMGKLLDGFSSHMNHYPKEQTFLLAEQPELSQEEVINHLRETRTEVLINYLPVGSQQATEFYAECALQAEVAFVNCIPVFIASHSSWAARFQAQGIPLIGDDIKAQLGATIVHRTLIDLCRMRGVKVKRTYQLNTGGNTDFLNMLNRNRLVFKKRSKTEAVTALCVDNLAEDDVHIGPSDYVPWQKDNKVCFLRIEGELFGNIPMNLELRLSVEDSPNSAGVAIDMIRCAKLALNRRMGGVIHGPSAYFCKHPPQQFTDNQAYQMTEAFISQNDQQIDEAEMVEAEV